MESPVEGYASPQGVAPIGFELQNMEEGVAPGPQPPPPPPDQSSLYPSANINANSDANGLGNQDMQDAEKGAASASPARSGDESQEDKTLFFKDGQRRIDFVFAYKHQDTVDEKKKTRREVFENNLRKSGLSLEQETVEYDKDDSIVYVKVHAPWNVLTAQAEIMNMKMPLAENDMVESIGSCWEMCPTPFDFDADILPPIPDYFTAAFSRERENQFIIKNRDTFFSTAQRSLLVYQLLQRCVFEEHEERGKSKFGIKKMVSNGCYDAAYPLHEGEFTSEHSLLTRGKANNRHLLYETWARPGAWYKFQPLDHIRKYFGEKVGIYFSWLGFYTGQLIPAAIVGLVVFFYGVGTFSSDPTSGEICNKTGPGASVMCPLCDGRCPYWYLWKSCVYSTVTYLFDNEATVFFAGFMALWAEFFIEMWKRRTAEIEYDWDVADFEEEETVRPEFEASVKKRRTNPINKTEEPYLDLCSRIIRYVSSLWVVIFMLCIVLAAVFAVIVYRMTVSALLFAVNQEEISQWSSTITSITAAVINLICIIILGRIYLILARILTDFETHRTQTEWEDSFTLKMFLFQFVNHYSSLFYIAFFKGKFIGRPGDYNREINAERQEECDPSGCLIELLIQLMIIMVGKQTFNNFKEIIIPKLMNWFKGRRVKEEEQKESKTVAVWERDYNMATMPDLGLFDEYLEMVLQYGFVTIFVAAFPLAPLFALINNIIEIRLDAYKFVTQWRRPLAARAQDIGIWFGILRGITTIAVASNAAIIAFTSDFIPKLVYRYGYDNDGRIEGYVLFSLSVFNVKDFNNRSVPVSPKIENVTQCHYRDFREGPPDYKLSMEYWHVLTAKLAFVIVFILVVVFLQWLVSFMITDVPRSVKMQMLREKYLAKESILAAEVLRRDHLGGGSNTNLTCMANGNPTPKIMWYKDGMELKKNDDFDIAMGDTSVPFHAISYLTPKVDEFNQATVFGTYRCEAMNIFGKNQVELTYNLAVVPEPAEAMVLKEYPTVLKLELQRPLKEGGQPVTLFMISYTRADDDSPDAVQTKNVSLKAGEDTTVAELTGLIPNTEYTLNITAVNNVGQGLPTNLSAMTADYSKPDKVEVISGRQGDTDSSYTLRWRVPMTGGAEISKYRVEYSAIEKVNTSVEPWQAIDVSSDLVTLNVDGEQTTSIKIDKLARNTYYLVKIKAVNRIGSSEVSTFIFKTSMGAQIGGVGAASTLQVGAATLLLVTMATASRPALF